MLSFSNFLSILKSSYPLVYLFLFFKVYFIETFFLSCVYMTNFVEHHLLVGRNVMKYYGLGALQICDIVWKCQKIFLSRIKYILIVLLRLPTDSVLPADNHKISWSPLHLSKWTRSATDSVSFTWHPQISRYILNFPEFNLLNQAETRPTQIFWVINLHQNSSELPNTTISWVCTIHKL